MSYTATPLTPPAGFVWVIPLYLLGSALIYRYVKKTGWVAASLSVLCVSFLIFLLMTVYSAYTSIFLGAQAPFLKSGYDVFWGREGGWAVKAFRRFNLFQGGVIVAVTIGCGAILGLIRRGRAGRTVLLGLTQGAIYLVCLVPFVVAGAWSGGWAGGYAHDKCERQLIEFGKAINAYAEAHGGRLPTAGGFPALHEQVKQWLPKDSYYSKPGVCPVADVFERDPVPYEWNSSLSGMTLEQLEASGTSSWVLSCPYHSLPECGFEFTITTGDLLHPTMKTLGPPPSYLYELPEHSGRHRRTPDCKRPLLMPWRGRGATEQTRDKN